MDMVALGERVREARKRRGLTQRELARLADLSVSLVRKLEQGDYENGLRLVTVHRLAVVLGVQTSFLAAGGAWEQVRLVLEGSDSTGAQDEPALGGVRAGAAAVDALYRDNRLAEMGVLLPALLRDADALVGSSVDGVQVQARAARSRVRLVTASLMIQAWQFGTAWHTLEGAMDDAPDKLGQMAVASQMCFALLRQGRLAEARDLAVRWSDETEPKLTRATRDELAAWAGLLIWVSAAAARDNLPDLAAETIRLAQMATAGTNGDFLPAHAPWHLVGPTMVATARAENAILADRPATTLAIGAQLERRGIAGEYVRHRLDVASAHAMLRQHQEAVTVLLQLRRAAPDWLACQRYAADTLGEIIRSRRTLSTDMRDLADFMCLPL
jgi:transcriptional regulator with XRE-family HTH domain